MASGYFSVMIERLQTAALQSRLGVLHAAELLSDDELFSLEDLTADHVEVEATTGMITLKRFTRTPEMRARR